MNSKPSLAIGDTLSKTWDLLSGAKWPIWTVTLVMIVVAIGVSLVIQQLFGMSAKNESFLLRFIVLPIVSNAIIAPFYAGAVMVGVKRARGEAVTASSGWQYFGQYAPIAITIVVVSFIASLLVIILNAPGIAPSAEGQKALFETVASLFSTLVYTFFILAVPLVADKKLSPICCSRSFGANGGTTVDKSVSTDYHCVLNFTRSNGASIYWSNFIKRVCDFTWRGHLCGRHGLVTTLFVRVTRFNLSPSSGYRHRCNRRLINE